MTSRVSREIGLHGRAAHISGQNKQDSPIYFQIDQSELTRDERKTITLELFLGLSMVELLIVEGKCSPGRAKSAHS